MELPPVNVVLLFNVAVVANVGVYTGIAKPCGVSAATDALRVVTVPEHIGELGEDDIVIVGGACDTVAVVVYLFEQLLFVAVSVYTPFPFIVGLETYAVLEDPLITVPGPAHE